jgi:hypothetical protein
MTHYNTTHETGDILNKFQRKASSQERIVFGFFKRHPHEMFSPSQVAVHLYRELKHTPITSIRRAITNLTYPGSLRKTNVKIQGPYGRPEYCWRLDHD